MINLLPDEVKERRKRERYKKILLVVTVVLFVILIGANNYVEQIVANYQKKLQQLEEQAQQLEVNEKVLVTQLKEKNEIQDQTTLITNLQNKLNYQWMIKDLQMIIPQQVWLEKLMIDKSERLLVVGGRAEDNSQLLETTERLEKYPYFKRVKIDSSEQLNEDLHFTIKGQVREQL